MEGEPISLGDITLGGSISVADPITINWGDGYLDRQLLEKGSRSLFFPDHVYEEDGHYVGRLTAYDTNGSEHSIDFDMVVENVPPVIILTKVPLISLDIESEFHI